jgi:ubiquinone/menaquinone biosynthesis C-methylase UbiE
LAVGIGTIMSYVYMSMEPSAEVKSKAAIAYNAASDHYDHPANTFWARSGNRTVERLGLRPGACVLDVCCGSGASAIPAAKAVGANGGVLGVDLADDLLDLARAKAEQSSYTHVEFRSGDLLDLDLPESSFDAVICVFGIFFIPDMKAVRKLWRLVRPGGKFAITTWGPRFLEPMSSRFWDAVREVNPDLFRNFNPWDRISEPDALRAMLGGAGISVVDVQLEYASAMLSSPEDWWPMVLGTGYRGTIDQLDPLSREQVRRNNLEFISEAGLTSVEANVIYATATKE